MSRSGETLEFAGVTFRLAPRNVRRARIEFAPPSPLLVFPRRSNPRAVLEANWDSIERRYERARVKWRTAAGLSLLERDENETRRLVEIYIRRYEKMMNVKCRNLKWRKMLGRWGTCSADGTIRLNRYLRHLPEPLVAYVVFHECLHLVIMGHGSRFRRAVAGVFPHYRQLDRELELYGIRMRHPDLGTVLVNL